jgi:hypothetical protein
LRYVFHVDRRRGSDRYDARMTDDWAIFRAEHLVPPLSSRGPKGSVSRSSVEFALPKGWSFYSSYGRSDHEPLKFDDPARKLDQPKGWMIVGKVASRTNTVGETSIVVAAPAGSHLRRQDTLAFVSWTLPTLGKIFGELPPQLLIVMADDPFWRGGLSGPRSLFVHADRPLVSENRTSTVLHELVHVVSGIHGDSETDWLAEGLAEYYSIEVLRRTGSISRTRFEETLAKLERWGAEAPTLLVLRSSGATTARAVGVLARADAEIHKASGGRASLDDLAAKLAVADQDISLALLQKLAAEVAGMPVLEFERARLTKSAR